MKKWILIVAAALLLVGCGEKKPQTLDKNTLRKTAFEHAGVQEGNAYDIDEEFDKEGGITYYELDFEADGVEYEYTLNAQTGEIVRSHKDPAAAPPANVQASATPATEPQPVTEPRVITEDEAIQIALEHAGLTKGGAKSITVEFDPSEGEYDVEFFTKGTEYEYEINAYTGEIRQADKDYD